MMEHAIRFNEDKVKELRAAYEAALKAGQEQFVFDGRDILTAYAKYMLEYLETFFSTLGDKT